MFWKCEVAVIFCLFCCPLTIATHEEFPVTDYSVAHAKVAKERQHCCPLVVFYKQMHNVLLAFIMLQLVNIDIVFSLYMHCRRSWWTWQRDCASGRASAGAACVVHSSVYLCVVATLQTTAPPPAGTWPSHAQSAQRRRHNLRCMCCSWATVSYPSCTPYL